MIAQRVLPDRSHEWGPRTRLRLFSPKTAWQRFKRNRQFASTPADPLYGLILNHVAKKHGVALEVMQDMGRRGGAISRARNEAALILRCLGLSYPDIARLLNYTNHTSALIAVRQAKGIL